MSQDELPGGIRRHPRIDAWVRVADERIVVHTGKVEIGQGIKTAIAMIAAEELEVAPTRIEVVTADTQRTPNEFITAGSMSVEDSGSAVRVAAAAAREAMLAAAAARLGVGAETVDVDDGSCSSALTNDRTSYWDLIEEVDLSAEIVALPPLKAVADYRVVGARATRVDLEAKLKGSPTYVHDRALPGLRHARVIKPPSQSARLIEIRPGVALDDAQLVHDGSFVAVVATTETVAVRTAERLASACLWTDDQIGVGPDELPHYLRDNVAHSLPVVGGMPIADETVPALPLTRGHRHAASYYRPLQMHGSLGPSAAVAQLVDGKLTVYSHSQGVELLKRELATVLQLDRDAVHVIHDEGAGCYGHNGADDVAFEAALIAMAVSPDPVCLKWSRADEHGFEPYAAAAVLDLVADLDDGGRIVTWSHESFSFSHNGRPRPAKGYSNLQSAAWREAPIEPVPRAPAIAREVGIHRNLTPMYDFPHTRLVKHLVAESPLRTSSFRGLGAFANVFAIESFMDELAELAATDPFEFRLRHLADPRAVAVLELLRDKLPDIRVQGVGRGVAVARYKNQQTYCALAVDVSVNDAAEVQLHRAVIAADVGLAIDPDGVVNQLEGGFVQAASAALKEEVLWDADGVVTSRDWASYPIIRFSEVPSIETHIVPAREQPAMGVGEASTGPTPAAIANAIYAATGVRVRRMPFTPERLRAAAAG